MNGYIGESLHLHAQPLASSMVSARSEVVLVPLFFSRLLSLRMSFASMLTLATSFTMHPILSLEFSNRYLSRVVFPASRTIRKPQSEPIHTQELHTNVSDAFGAGRKLYSTARRHQGTIGQALHGAGDAPEPRKPESIDTGIGLAAAMVRRFLPDARPSSKIDSKALVPGEL